MFAERLTTNGQASPSYLADLFVFSNFISQFNTSTQRDIFMLLAQKHPEWKMSDESRDEVKSIATPKIRTIVLGYHTPPQNETGKPPKLHYDVSREPDSEEGVRSQINKDLAAFQRTFNNTGFLPREIMLRSVAIGLANSDHKYLVERDGRSRIVDPDRKATFFGDKYLSLVCYFILEGNPMGIADYDEMFRELTPFLTEPLRGELVDENQFEEMVGVYVAYHPQSRVRDLTR